MGNNFWEVKSMEDFTHDEWEQICLKCGKCCCEKARHGNSILFYNRVCDNLDLKTGLCKQYENRLCDECLKVDWELLCNHPEIFSEKCAYRMLKEHGCLPKYHPLITGDTDSVKKAGQTVLDWENVHTFSQIKDAISKIVDEAGKQMWDAEEYADAVQQGLQTYYLQVMEKHKR